jgi:hypothetical protein
LNGFHGSGALVRISLGVFRRILDEKKEKDGEQKFATMFLAAGQKNKKEKGDDPR